ncbi:glycosyltransferase [Imhoffiella purpurea]|uniref:Glycosyl transferase, group 2 family protein n=1 Tax=Imhoffiella purpurea TaxID=1249627 RepID=W9VIU9_9GAMM|nr:glycosyltransferase [Imhoffiella purpurea]EXJ15982.1 Glycosyl transferase, group 2 family protein [Imhoffiella purpurea]
MSDNRLAALYARHSGKVSDKWASYLREYERLFSPFREDPIDLLEIGVQNGGSLEIWARYFPQARSIIGCDIDPACGELTFEDPRIAVVVGDAGTQEIAERIVGLSERFHLVIEDGSHRSGDIIQSFCRYFPRLLDGGLFVAEDLHCSYWHEFEGGLYDPHSALAFFKRLADVINRDHWGLDQAVRDALAPFAIHYGLDLDEIPYERIHSISFLDSLCVIDAAPASETGLGMRVVTGTQESVCQGNREVEGTPSRALDQRDALWSNADAPAVRDVQSPDAMVAFYHKAVAELSLQSRQGRAHDQAELQSLAGQLDRLRQEHAALGVRAAELEGNVNTLRAACNRHLEELERQNDRHLEELEQRRASHLAEIHGERARHLEVVESLQEAHRAERDENAVLSHHVAGLNQSIASLHRSLSWRLTAPLRLGLDGARAFGSGVGYLGDVVGHGGGLGGTLKLTREVLREEGLRGVLWRLNNVRKLRAAPVPGQEPEGSASQPSNNYGLWIQRYDRLDEAARERMRGRIETFDPAPLVSVVMPVYEPPVALLDAAIRSVRDQIYPHWELCIADDASPNAEVRALIERHMAEDARVKAVFRAENGHISAASNDALALATGDFIALLDHDDLLAEHALFWVAETIVSRPGVGLIYSDEDKITEDGRRYDPYFKCDLNQELLLAQNMISHLGVYRRRLVEEVGGFRLGFEGSQDYDLALRVLEHLDSDQVHHIPRVLYHWRSIAGSTALAVHEKSYATAAARRAVGEHLERLGRDAEVTPAPGAPVYSRVRYALPDPLPSVSILILTRDRADLLETCIGSILSLSTYPDFEILVVDNGSVEPRTKRLFSLLPSDRVRVIADDRPFNFSALNNVAARAARGEMLCLLNNDIEVLTPDWLEEMVSFAARPDVGCVGARLWYPDGRLQHGGALLGVGGVANHAHLFAARGDFGYFGRAVLHQEFSAVTAACLTIRRSVYEEVGGMDEDLAVAFNDIDFCLRVRQAGYRNLWTPYAELNHHESASRGAEVTPEQQARFVGEVERMRARWGDALIEDPAYSPNLTLDHVDFSLAWPPRVALIGGAAVGVPLRAAV